MAAYLDNNTTEKQIYRYKFSENFQSQLETFTKKHKFDNIETFRQHWSVWLDENKIFVDREIQLLESNGYNGDAIMKMYKSVRYYHKNKSEIKNEPKKRRIYISLDRDLLDAIDSHIDGNISSRPAIAYKNFMDDEQNSELIEKSVEDLKEHNLNTEDINLKIKKTYKNRFYQKKKTE